MYNALALHVYTQLSLFWSDYSGYTNCLDKKTPAFSFLLNVGRLPSEVQECINVQYKDCILVDPNEKSFVERCKNIPFTESTTILPKKPSKIAEYRKYPYETLWFEADGPFNQNPSSSYCLVLNRPIIGKLRTFRWYERETLAIEFNNNVLLAYSRTDNNQEYELQKWYFDEKDVLDALSKKLNVLQFFLIHTYFDTSGAIFSVAELNIRMKKVCDTLPFYIKNIFFYSR